MNKNEADREAKRLAAMVIQRELYQSGLIANDEKLSDEDKQKVWAALDRLCNRLEQDITIFGSKATLPKRNDIMPPALK